MPARQPTPGPSTGIVQPQQTNTRKRPNSESDGYSIRVKKPKPDKEDAVKDKSKKTRGRRRKRKQSITATHMIPRSKSRSSSATQQNPGLSLLDTQSLVPPDSQAVEGSLVERAGEDVDSDVVSRILWLGTVNILMLSYFSHMRTKEKARLRRRTILNNRNHRQKY